MCPKTCKAGNPTAHTLNIGNRKHAFMGVVTIFGEIPKSKSADTEGPPFHTRSLLPLRGTGFEPTVPVMCKLSSRRPKSGTICSALLTQGSLLPGVQSSKLACDVAKCVSRKRATSLPFAAAVGPRRAARSAQPCNLRPSPSFSFGAPSPPMCARYFAAATALKIRPGSSCN